MCVCGCVRRACTCACGCILSFFQPVLGAVSCSRFCRRYQPLRPGPTQECFSECSFPYLTVGAWSACPANCVAANQTRTVSCSSTVGGNLPLSFCTVPAGLDVARSRRCPSNCLFQVLRGNWSECSSLCGPGKQFRTVYCVSRTGREGVPPALCGNGSVPAGGLEVRDCVGGEASGDPALCVPVELRVSAWSACSGLCMSIQQAPPQSTREAQCFNRSSGLVVPTAVCAAAGYALPVLSRECNTEPCAVPTYQTGPWGVCSASCGLGVQLRSVACEDGRGQVTAGCPLPAPVSQQPCFVRGACRCVADSNCPFAGNASCVNFGCSCGLGSSGEGCQIVSPAFVPRCLLLPSSFVVQDSCCSITKSVSMEGLCCGLNELDANGRCCDGVLDACGVCNGPAVALDMQMVCCNHTLSASGLCCAHDECGVCGGLNACLGDYRLEGVLALGDVFGALSSVRLLALQVALQEWVAAHVQQPINSVTITAFLNGSAMWDAASRAAPSTELVEPRHLSSSETPFTLLFTTEAPMAAGEVTGRLLAGGAMPFLDSPSALLLSVVSEGRRGVCGNGLCEVGEACSNAQCTDGGCLADCYRPFRLCDGDPDTSRRPCNSHGRCNPSTGSCEVRAAAVLGLKRGEVLCLPNLGVTLSLPFACCAWKTQ